jgi:hypothetical protein
VGEGGVTEWQTPLSDVDLALVLDSQRRPPTADGELELIGLVTEALQEENVSVIRSSTPILRLGRAQSLMV